MSAWTENHGASHPVDEEVTLTAYGIPGATGKLEINAIECDEVEDSVDTFDTAEGQPHSLGRTKASKDFGFTIYANDTVALGLLHAWKAAVDAGTPGHKLPLTLTYKYASGVPGRVLELLSCMVVGIRDSAGGQQKAHTVRVMTKYWKAKAILV